MTAAPRYRICWSAVFVWLVAMPGLVALEVLALLYVFGVLG